MAISGHHSEQSLLHYNKQPSTSQLRTCSEVLSQGSTSDRSESFAVTAINIQKEVQENSIVVSTATEKTTSGFGSFFNNCTVQNVHVTLGSNFSLSCWHLLSYCFQCFLKQFCNGLFSVIDVLFEAFWLILTLCSNFVRTVRFLTDTENVACCKLTNKNARFLLCSQENFVFNQEIIVKYKVPFLSVISFLKIKNFCI